MSITNVIKGIEKLEERLKQKKEEDKEFPFENWVDMAKSTVIPSGGNIVKFDPYEYQIKCIENIEKYPVSIIAKGRQLGLSQIIATWLFFRACKEPGFTGVIISKAQKDTSILAQRIRVLAGQLSQYITLETDSLMHLKIKGSGQLFFANAKIDAVRGIDSVSVLFFDEAGFLEDLNLMFSASSPAMSLVENPRVILSSTPNGIEGNDYGQRLVNAAPKDTDPVEICEKIRNGIIEPYQYYTNEHGTCTQFIHWKSHPNYSERPNYLQDIANRLDEPITKIEREYDLRFTEAQTSFFSAELIVNAKSSIRQYYDSNNPIYIGTDSSGQGKDNTVHLVLQQRTIEGRHQLEIIDLYCKSDNTVDGDIIKLCDLIQKYKPTAVGIEKNNVGVVVYERISQQFKHKTIVGITSTTKSKIRMAEQLLLAFEQGIIVYNEKKYSLLTRELMSFKWLDTNKLGSSDGFKDDIVCALMFAVDMFFEFALGKNK